MWFLGAAKWFVGLFLGKPLDRILTSIDKGIDNETEREKLKLRAVEIAANAQVEMLNGKSRALLWFFALPLGAYHAFALIHAGLMCRVCAFPATWEVGPLPPPLDKWDGLIVASLFGYGVALEYFQRKR